MHSSLNMILTAFTPREMIAFYLLASSLRKTKADKSNLQNEFDEFAEFAEFAKEFLRNLNSFSIYDNKPPRGMTRRIFETYRNYKQESKILTTGESLSNRLEIMLAEYQRMHPFITKDPVRLHDTEQKRILYFRQKGLCGECGKEMRFDRASAHHIIAHESGGATDDLTNAALLHEKCHGKREKRRRKEARAQRAVP
jgi:hypothetical protein